MPESEPEVEGVGLIIPKFEDYFPLFQRDEAQYTIEEIRAYFSRFNLSSTLSIMSRTSVELWGKEPEYVNGQAVAEFLTPFISIESIRVASDLSPYQFKQTTLAPAMRMAFGLIDNFQLPSADDPDNKRNFLNSFIFRTAYEQFPYQVRRLFYFFRYIDIFSIVDNSNSDAEYLKSKFEQIYGISMSEFSYVGFSVFTITLISKLIPIRRVNLRTLDIRNVQYRPKDEDIDKFLAVAARTRDQLRERLAQTPAQGVGYDRSLVNPLIRYPLVDIGGHYYVPSLWYLLQRISSGFYYDFLGRIEGEGKSINEFTSLVGRLFEDYVGNQLSEQFSSKELIGELEYRVSKNNYRGPDWTIIEGDKAILIECKSRSLIRKAREYASIDDMLKEIGDIADAIRRLPAKAEHIRQKLGPMAAWPDITDFEFVVVTLEPWWPESLTRDLVSRRLKGTPGEGVKYHLMWIEQLEELGAFKGATSIFEMLRLRWQGDPNLDTSPFMVQQAARLDVKRDNPRLRRLERQYFSRFLKDLDGDDAASIFQV